MLATIQEASTNFCVHQIRLPYALEDGVANKRMLIAYIDIEAQDLKKYRVYLASDKAFMQRIAKVFLEEDQSDEETLVDMTLETANLIIGSAKVIAKELNKNSYTIGTPHFEKFDFFDFDTDESKSIQIENDLLSIAIKELNG